MFPGAGPSTHCSSPSAPCGRCWDFNLHFSSMADDSRVFPALQAHRWLNSPTGYFRTSDSVFCPNSLLLIFLLFPTPAPRPALICSRNREVVLDVLLFAHIPSSACSRLKFLSYHPLNPPPDVFSPGLLSPGLLRQPHLPPALSHRILPFRSSRSRPSRTPQPAR